MAHKTQRDSISLIKKYYSEYFDTKKVLEVGSLNLNGSIRNLFDNCEYIGCDLAEGKDVDIAIQGQMLDFPSNHFDVVISTECFEHNPYWIETLSNMLRMLKSDGMIVLSCASAGTGEHGTARTSPGNSPFTSSKGWKYYKNLTIKDFKVLNYDNWLSSHFLIEGGSYNDLLLIGFGKEAKHKIQEQFIAAVGNSMKYTLRSLMLCNLNKVIGNYLFQEFYILVRKYMPALLRYRSE